MHSALESSGAPEMNGEKNEVDGAQELSSEIAPRGES